MARVFIDDLWVKNDSGGRPPTAAMKRSLANAKDPMKANMPMEHRTTRYGKGNRWRCRWYQADKAAGIKKQRNRSFAKLADAEEFKAAMEDDIRRGRYHDPSREHKPFHDVADEWVASKIDVKPGTLGRYKRELRLYINPKWGQTPIGGITAAELQKWVGRLQDGTYERDPEYRYGKRGLKPRSIRNIVRVVMGGVLKYAVANDIITDNPMTHVTTPKIIDDDDDMIFLTITEIEDLAIEAGKVKDNPQDTLIIRWQAYVGARIGESFALQIRDMDFGSRRARIRRTWADDGNGRAVLGPPKNGKPRWAAFPEFLASDLRRQCEGREPDDYVFRAGRGGNLWVNTWRTRVWYPALRLAGMEDDGVRIQDLRHTYASLAIASGCDVKTLQSQLGHSSAVITLDTYAALWPERLDEVADAVGDARALALGEVA